MPIPHAQLVRTPDRLKGRPTWLLSRAHARSLATLRAGFEAGGNGLHGYHYRLLSALEQWGPASQADLGRDTGIDRSDVTAALLLLETRGLVERRVDPDHKRRNIVTMTPAGLAALRDLDGVLDDIQREFLAPLTEPQQRQLLALLTRLVEG